MSVNWKGCSNTFRQENARWTWDQPLQGPLRPTFIGLSRGGGDRGGWDLEEPLGLVTLECVERCLAMIACNGVSRWSRGNEAMKGEKKSVKTRQKEPERRAEPVVNAQIIVRRYTDWQSLFFSSSKRIVIVKKYRIIVNIGMMSLWHVYRSTRVTSFLNLLTLLTLYRHHCGRLSQGYREE